MPSLKRFRVEFDRPSATYVTGETVTGNIIVDTTKEKDVRADSRVQIPVGFNQYPFAFRLPQNLPSSFEHRDGYIRYTLKAVIDRPWKFDHECKTAFTVISSLDLNAYPEKCIGINDEASKHYCCFCCVDQGTMNVLIRIPSTGYVPGQVVNTMLEYKNSADKVSITKISVKLIQEVRLYASFPRSKVKTEWTEITSTKHEESFPVCGQIVLELVIPPLPPSSLDHCSIIDLEYKLVVSVHVSGPHRRIETRYPVLIGTIPLYCPPSAPPIDMIKDGASTTLEGTMEDPAIMPVPMPLPTQSIAPYPATDSQIGGFPQPTVQPQPIGFVVSQPQPSSSSIYREMPPPSYEECMSGTQTIRDHDESNYIFGANDPFTPRYPVFRQYPVYTSVMNDALR